MPVEDFSLFHDCAFNIHTRCAQRTCYIIIIYYVSEKRIRTKYGSLTPWAFLVFHDRIVHDYGGEVIGCAVKGPPGLH